MINFATVFSGISLVCLISCSASSQKSFSKGEKITVALSSTDRGTKVTFTQQGSTLFEEENTDSRGFIIDSISTGNSTQYFICHEYDSYCSLYRYHNKDGRVIKQEITDITETLLLIGDPSKYPLDYRQEKLFELQMKGSNKIIVRTNVFPDFDIPNISREIIIDID